ncbi:MAG: dTDP-4-dehydrorhamnose 3,5-epimerase [Nitrospira sp. LK70]|nr:dTDP-4-dehydrorhamnose 3,5-epimerase [Nitrospira sp. LK70]
MRVTTIDIAGVLLLEPSVMSDHRGCFLETYHEHRYREAGIDERFVQDNFSRSIRNTVRGLHFQEPHAQGKLVMALEGTVYDVVVDIRKGSPTFGKWYGVELSGKSLQQMYVPPGCAHGFCVTSDSACFLYKCTAYYSPKDDRGILWNDPALGILWPVRKPILSAKDQTHHTLAAMDAELPFFRGTR